MIDLTVNFDYGIELTWLLIDSFINWPHEESLFDVTVDCVSEIIQSPTQRQELNGGSRSLRHSHLQINFLVLDSALQDFKYRSDHELW